jgi:hypothetical protein
MFIVSFILFLLEVYDVQLLISIAVYVVYACGILLFIVFATRAHIAKLASEQEKPQGYHILFISVIRLTGALLGIPILLWLYTNDAISRIDIVLSGLTYFGLFWLVLYGVTRWEGREQEGHP